MTINQVLEKLKETKKNTYFSEKIFDLEEGKEDTQLKSGRRDWLIISDIYGDPTDEKYTQHFHLENYLNFKIHDGLSGNEYFRTRCYNYIRNVALIIYIREVIFEEPKEHIEQLYNEAVKRYTGEGSEKNKINDPSFAAKMRRKISTI